MSWSAVNPKNKATDPSIPVSGKHRRQTQTAGAGDNPDASPARKSNWVTRFGSWSDYEVGVHLIEDRQNRRMTIQFDEKPSGEVRALMKGEQYGYCFDAEDEVWYKKISRAKPRQSRQEAEDLAFQEANMIREEKGLEPKKAFAPGRGVPNPPARQEAAAVQAARVLRVGPGAGRTAGPRSFATNAHQTTQATGGKEIMI